MKIYTIHDSHSSSKIRGHFWSKDVAKYITIAILAVGIILRMYFYFQSSISPFMSTPITLGIEGIREGHITDTPFEGSYWAGHAGQFSVHRVFTALLLVTLSQVLNVNIDALAYLPLIGMVLPLMGYIIIRRFTNSHFLSISFAAFLVVVPLLDVFFLEYQPLSYMYHFVLLYFTARLLTGSLSTRAFFPLAVLLIFGSYQTYYTVELNNFIMFTVILISIIFFKWYFFKSNEIRKLAKYKHTLVSLALVTLLIFTGIDFIIYNYATGQTTDRFSHGIEQLMNRLTSAAELGKYSPTSSPLFIALDITIRVLLLLGAIIPLAYYIVKRKLPERYAVLMPIFVSLLVYSLVEPIIYQGFTTDYLVSRNMILTLPLASFILIANFGIISRGSKIHIDSRMIGTAAILIILVLAVARYSITLESDYQWRSSRGIRDVAMTSIGELMLHLNERYIASTHDVSSIIFVQSVIHEKEPQVAPRPFMEKMVPFGESLINNNQTMVCSEMYEDLILPKITDRPLAGEIWGGEKTHTEPLGASFYNINNFKCMDKVSDNDMLSMYTRINSR